MLPMPEWTIGAVVDTIAEAIPEREMTVCGDRRTTFAQMATKTRRFANFLADNGFGVRRERAQLDNWECGQDRVALIMYNDQYPDMVIGCLKARTVPVNINHYYSPGEIADLLEYIKPRAIVYHRSLGAKFADVLPPQSAELLIEVDDGTDGAALSGSIALEDAVSQGDPDRLIAGSPDDVIMICTGGTTGRPKGVMWRQCDTYVSSMTGADHDCATEIHDKVRAAGAAPWMAVSPLMHAAGLWTAFAGTLSGQTVVLYDDRAKFSAQRVLETIEREKVGMLTMVGDAYAAPLVEEFDRRPYDVSSLFGIGTGGAATNPKHQQALMARMPQLTIINGYGSSETGNVGFAHSKAGSLSDDFALGAGARVVSEDRNRYLKPGEDEVGWVVRSGRIPLGYFDDREATLATFPVVDGQRVVISGDRAALRPDGTLRLLGRDSLVINTGGEKVFVEEIEAVLRAHPGVADALVVGRPSERWGSEIVALVQCHKGTDVEREALHEHCVATLARFKAHKDYLFVPMVRRLGNGKADYRWAKATAVRSDAAVPD
jgi:3-oxocholest-4-en-26-oate---CoA ligase